MWVTLVCIFKSQILNEVSYKSCYNCMQERLGEMPGQVPDLCLAASFQYMIVTLPAHAAIIAASLTCLGSKIPRSTKLAPGKVSIYTVYINFKAVYVKAVCLSMNSFVIYTCGCRPKLKATVRQLALPPVDWQFS